VRTLWESPARFQNRARLVSRIKVANICSHSRLKLTAATPIILPRVFRKENAFLTPGSPRSRIF
jgi:hypothetical protein